MTAPSYMIIFNFSLPFSVAKTRDAGCRPYMAPERIDPQRARGYDVRSDVWSLGITLIELSTGRFPYRKWNSVFDQLQQVRFFKNMFENFSKIIDREELC